MNEVNIKALQKNLIEANQACVSLQNITKQYHKLMFIALLELRKIDHSNRLFSNGSVSDNLLKNIDIALKTSKNDLPKESFSDFHGDNKPGLPPSALRTGGHGS